MSPTQTDGDTVLVITARDSDTGAAVTSALQDLGVRTVRFDLADLGRAVHVSARCDGSQWQGSLTARSRDTKLRDVRSVFWCHPTPPRVWVDGMIQAQTQWVSQEALAGLAGVLGTLECLHVKHPLDIRRAQVKAGVVAAAERAGLTYHPPGWRASRPALAGSTSAPRMASSPRPSPSRRSRPARGRGSPGRRSRARRGFPFDRLAQTELRECRRWITCRSFFDMAMISTSPPCPSREESTHPPGKTT
ncbi:MvdC/MvdD family ATP grasp protein [Streptomyces anulatus]